MKTSRPTSRPTYEPERGSAVVMFLGLLAIMLVLIVANGKTVLLLKQEIRLIEQRQVQRLERSQTDTVNPRPATVQPNPSTP